VPANQQKKVDDSAAGDAAVTKSDGPDPVVDTPMSFDAQGSDSGKISGLETIHFEYDKAALSSATKKTLQGNADWMKNHAKVNIQIEGHCDARGSIEYNLSLGERRAKTVKDYMVSLGLSEKRISIISYGKEKPVASGDSESAMAKNRRANFVPLN
jgi:peptidoglycan-associated lipoprotein